MSAVLPAGRRSTRARQQTTWNRTERWPHSSAPLSVRCPNVRASLERMSAPSARHVAVIAPPWYPLPPTGYGGIELVVYLLVRGLRAAGVTVTLYGCEGSMPGTTALVPAGWSAALGTLGQSQREQAYTARVLDALDGLRDIDVIHDHTEAGLAAVAFAFADRAPVVHTVHGPVTAERAELLSSIGSRVAAVPISANQRDSAALPNWTSVVHNSVDMDNLRVATRAEKEGYVLCLARVSPEKGQHLAIEAARRAGMPLVLAGKVGETASERRYFEEMIAPHVDGRAVRHIENIAGRQKTEMIARATALIHAVTWPEPFGLAMVEAMASGTPVVGIARGAVPELVVHGETGFLCRDSDQLTDGLRRADEIDIAACARSARERFHPSVMTERYLDVYAESRRARPVLAGRPIVLPSAPATAAS